MCIIAIYYASFTLPSCTSDIVLVNYAPVANNATASVKSGTAISGTVTATDPDGDSITYSRVLSPAHGALSFNSNGTYTYTAALGYVGADSFTFRASDGKDYSNTAVVSITVTGIPTESITVTSPSDSVSIGKTLQMAATVSPNDATNKSVIWSVNNSTIAAISQSVCDGKAVAK
jgi:VCBS repeat-containing protein